MVIWTTEWPQILLENIEEVLFAMVKDKRGSKPPKITLSTSDSGSESSPKHSPAGKRSQSAEQRKKSEELESPTEVGSTANDHARHHRCKSDSAQFRVSGQDKV